MMFLLYWDLIFSTDGGTDEPTRVLIEPKERKDTYDRGVYRLFGPLYTAAPGLAQPNLSLVCSSNVLKVSEHEFTKTAKVFPNIQLSEVL